jgi:SAM-dependent methyltransferase
MSSGDHAKGILARGKSEPGDGYGNEYLQWKDWNAEKFGTLSKHDEADFSAQMKKSRMVFPRGSRVLEIGFGNGKFLAYGAKQEWEMHGTEIDNGLVERARQRGFHAVCTDTLKPFPEDHFKLVVAFDVLEHLPQENLAEFLWEVNRILARGGVFIARFPNGDSPLGMANQNGDPTHKMTIGSYRARYFADKLGVDLVYLGAEPQALWAGPAYFAHRLFAFPVKWSMNFFLNLVFSPRAPLAYCSPNLVMIFRAVKPAPPA